jgi:hypothetical protein
MALDVVNGVGILPLGVGSEMVGLGVILIGVGVFGDVSMGENPPRKFFKGLETG